MRAMPKTNQEEEEEEEGNQVHTKILSGRGRERAQKSPCNARIAGGGKWG